MKKIILDNDKLKLISENNRKIKDTRTGLKYTEVICKSENEKYFVEE